VSGFREILGAGENLIDVAFPVNFIQIPMFVNGSSLAPGSELVDDNYPVVSAIVAHWYVDEPDLELYGSSARQFFKGAQIALTATGPETQRILFSWQFTGMAISSPMAGQRKIPNTFETGRKLG
jgi:hypothetical protein